VEENKQLQRVNARLGYTQNKWLDEESARTGISKSSLIQMAVEQYIAQKQALNAMSDYSVMLDRLENIEKALRGIGDLEKAINKKEETD